MAEDQNYTGVVLVLIPEASDPVVGASSEPAHMTTIWLGDISAADAEKIETIIDEAEAYAAQLEGPVVVPVVERGQLGDEGADVAFLERTEALLALRDGLLAASPVTSEAMNAVEQYPEWTPHVTLGYPETPAAGEYDGDAVTFDRIGVWVGDEQYDFVMGGEMADKIEASAVQGLFVVEFDRRSDDGDRLIGPFASREEASEALEALRGEIGPWEANIVSLAAIQEAAEKLPETEMPADELEDGEEEVTEIPVHGVATLEGKPTGDGRGFRPGALSFGSLPAPLGYEYVSTHGGTTSDVAIVGRIDEFWTIASPTEGEGVFEVRWRGVILTTKEYAARAIESIVDGSYTGLSVIVDAVTVDVEEEREELRQRILRDQSENGGKPVEASVLEGESGIELDETEIEQMLDMMVGNGTTPTTWFSEARIRRFDMVPTGAFMEGYAALGAEFADEMTAEQIEASAQALADCGCLDDFEVLDLSGNPVENARAAAEAIVAAAMAPGTKDGPGWITHPIPTSRIRRYWVRGKGAAKIRWGEPGDFNRCRMQLAKYVQNPEWLAGLCANMHKEALGVWPGQEGGRKLSITASAGPRHLFSLVASAEPVDAELFRNPGLTEPVGVVIDDERIYGYIAVWNVCHIAQPDGPGSCTMAPRSATDYAYFRTGTVITTEGPLAVGSITMGTGHAGGQDSARAAASHYDNTGAVVADVACGEDRIGIWYSGRKRPGVTDEQIYELAASGRLSGDWRAIGGNYELIAALAVNVPGFPIPRTSLAASADTGRMNAIIAAGVVTDDVEAWPFDSATIVEMNASTIAGIALAAVEHYVTLQDRAGVIEVATAGRSAFSAHELMTARRKLAMTVKEIR